MEPLRATTGHVAQELERLALDGASDSELREGVNVLVSRGLHPSCLPSLIAECRTRKARIEDPRLAAYDA